MDKKYIEVSDITHEIIFCHKLSGDLAVHMLEHVLKLPIVDATPVVHAHWENTKFDCGDWIGICSNCGSKCPADNYCGTCGAKMDEVIDE